MNIKHRDKSIFAAIVFLLLAYMVAVPKQYDPDSFWHITIGQYMLQHHTITTTAIYTFAGKNLPFVAHEWLFEVLAAALYTVGGWKALYILTTLSVAGLILGYYRLVKVSRKELGYSEFHPLLHMVIFCVVAFLAQIYLSYRPQLLSTPIVLWYFITLREFQERPTWKRTLTIIGISILIANLHGGIWPVLIVFYIMLLIESYFKQNVTMHHIYSLVGLILGGLLNPQGIKTIGYLWEIQNDNSWISEWQPINFQGNYVLFILLLLFVWSISHSFTKGVFRFIFTIGIFFLGIGNYKEFLYLVLFIPYYFAITVEHLPKSLNELLNSERLKWLNIENLYLLIVRIGIVFFLILGLMIPLQKVNSTLYPVQEMNYIMTHWKHQNRPKVFTSYGSGGYVMYRGADVFTDGRQIPFITKASERGPNHWTAYKQTYYGIDSENPYVLKQILNEYPDANYLILQKEKEGSLQEEYLKHIMKTLGKPIYSGDYGYVWKLK